MKIAKLSEIEEIENTLDGYRLGFIYPYDSKHVRELQAQRKALQTAR